ncbi:hypothetical protein QBC32DRAFT_366329, partial [Pseudoneurospora amorphoporcata]
MFSKSLKRLFRNRLSKSSEEIKEMDYLEFREKLIEILNDDFDSEDEGSDSDAPEPPKKVKSKNPAQDNSKKSVPQEDNDASLAAAVERLSLREPSDLARVFAALLNRQGGFQVPTPTPTQGTLSNSHVVQQPQPVNVLASAAVPVYNRNDTRSGRDMGLNRTFFGPSRDTGRPIRCYFCGEERHTIQNCEAYRVEEDYGLVSKDFRSRDGFRLWCSRSRAPWSLIDKELVYKGVQDCNLRAIAKAWLCNYPQSPEFRQLQNWEMEVWRGGNEASPAYPIDLSLLGNHRLPNAVSCINPPTQRATTNILRVSDFDIPDPSQIKVVAHGNVEDARSMVQICYSQATSDHTEPDASKQSEDPMEKLRAAGLSDDELSFYKNHGAKALYDYLDFVASDKDRKLAVVAAVSAEPELQLRRSKRLTAAEGLEDDDIAMTDVAPAPTSKPAGTKTTTKPVIKPTAILKPSSSSGQTETKKTSSKKVTIEEPAQEEEKEMTADELYAIAEKADPIIAASLKNVKVPLTLFDMLQLDRSLALRVMNLAALKAGIRTSPVLHRVHGTAVPDQNPETNVVDTIPNPAFHTYKASAVSDLEELLSQDDGLDLRIPKPYLQGDEVKYPAASDLLLSGQRGVHSSTALVPFPTSFRPTESREVTPFASSPTLYVNVNHSEGEKWAAMIDTGAELCCISKRAADVLGLAITPSRFTNVDSNGNSKRFVGETVANIYFAKWSISVPFQVSENRWTKHDILLGQNFIDATFMQFHHGPGGVEAITMLIGQKPILCAVLDTQQTSYSGMASPSDQTIVKPVNVRTMYKRVDKKVKPVDDAPSDGSTPEGSTHWKSKRMAEAQARIDEHREVNSSEWDEDFLPKFSTIEKGSRLTPERLESMLEDVRKVLQPKEVELFTHILYNREAALAWNFTECGRIHRDVFPPQRIRTIPHRAWQSKSVPIPKALTDKVIELLRDRVNRGILEESHAAYRNNWFLVKKKDGGLRLINDAQKINGVTLRDAFAPPG